MTLTTLLTIKIVILCITAVTIVYMIVFLCYGNDDKTEENKDPDNEKEKHYELTWTIDIWADSPDDAVKQALETQRDPGSMATMFHVKGKDPGNKTNRWIDAER